MSTDIDDFTAEVQKKLGGLIADDWIAAHPGEHLWATYRGYESCAFCGIMRRRDDKNNPCKGIVRVGLRGERQESEG